MQSASKILFTSILLLLHVSNVQASIYSIPEGSYVYSGFESTYAGETITGTYNESTNELCVLINSQTVCEDLGKVPTFTVTSDTKSLLLPDDILAAFSNSNSVTLNNATLSICGPSLTCNPNDYDANSGTCSAYIPLADSNQCSYWKQTNGATNPTTQKGGLAGAVSHAIELEKSYHNMINSLEYGSVAQQAKLLEIKNELATKNEVERVELANNSNALFVFYKEGFTSIIASAPHYSKAQGIQPSPWIMFANEHTLKRAHVPKRTTSFLRGITVKDKEVLSLTAQYFDWGNNDDVPLISDLLSQNGYNIHTIRYDRKNSGSIEDFKHWDKYSIVLLSSHGEANSNMVVIHTNAPANTQNSEQYNDDIKAQRVLLWGDSYGVTQDFISQYNTKFPNSLIYMSICKGAYNSKMADAFISKGAGTVIAYDDYVGVEFVKEHGTKLFNDLLLKDASFSNATEVGVKESDPDPATMKLYGSSELSIQPSGTTTYEESIISSVESNGNTIQGYLFSLNNTIAYVSSSLKSLYLLEGKEGIGEKEGQLKWSANKASEYTSLHVKENTLELNTSNSTQNSLILGYFIHYDDGAMDWVLVNNNSKSIKKLNGLNDNGELDLGNDISKGINSIDINTSSNFIQLTL